MRIRFLALAIGACVLVGLLTGPVGAQTTTTTGGKTTTGTGIIPGGTTTTGGTGTTTGGTATGSGLSPQLDALIQAALAQAISDADLLITEFGLPINNEFEALFLIEMLFRMRLAEMIQGLQTGGGLGGTTGTGTTSVTGMGIGTGIGRP
jgi:hypothetical protein